MKNTKAEDNFTVKHLLGYLTPKQWADALKDDKTDKTLIWQLIEIQEQSYGGNIKEEVEYLLKQKKVM